MKKIQSLLVIAFLLFQFLPAFVARPILAQGRVPDDGRFAEKIKKIEAFVEKQMKSDGTVGLTVGFVKDDFQWVKGFGLADLENKIPTKPESSYRMASVTKPMTAVGILTLVEDGKIDLDAEVQKYVPYFPKKKYPVTVRQLLGHLGGISHYKNYDLEGHFKDHKNTRQAIAVFEDFDLIAEPGTRYSYTSYGFNLLGAVIEGASGKSYGEYMTENVWKPLQMNATVMDDPLRIIPNRVKGYQLIDGKVRNSEFVDMSSRFSAGGIRSTVPDMLAFAKGMYEGKLLTEKMRDEMWTGQTTKAGLNVGYGYGWRTNSSNGRFMVGHSGSQAETKTYLLSLPNENFAAAVAINFEEANPVIYPAEIFKILFDEPWQIRYYSNDEKDGIILRGMDLGFDFGMSHYAQFGKPLATDESELNEAFAYFKAAVNSSTTEEMGRRLGMGIHPATGEVSVKMISYMAGKLKENGKDLDVYYKQGAVLFFDDYIKWYQQNPNYPDNLKFEKSFEQKVARWKSDWATVWNKETQDPVFDDIKNIRAASENLSRMFAGKSVYPEYINDLDNAVTNLAVAGDFTGAFQVGQINQKLYPASSKTNATMGILYTLAGEKTMALAALKKSLEINPQGDASATGLNTMAYNLQNIGQTKAGLNLLLTAIELHPKDANLYDSAGEFYLKLKDNQKGIEYYKKALEINPDYPNAKIAKEIIAKMNK